MRRVVVTTKTGYKKVFLVRDTDGDEIAEKGIPVGPPDFDMLDFDAIKKEINNRFADEGILTWQDVQKSTVGLGIVCSVVKRHVAGAFKAAAAESGETSRIINGNGKRGNAR